jgi:hypothetical protein
MIMLIPGTATTSHVPTAPRANGGVGVVGVRIPFQVIVVARSQRDRMM